MRTFTRNRRNVSNLNYHIITCPKFRKPYLLKNKKQLLSCFKKSCIMHKCIIKEIEIMPDHVHIFINVLKPYKFKLTRFIHHLKGYSSFFIRKNKPWMKKYKAFWSPSYFVESIGHISSNVIRKYIRNQTVYMKKDYKYRHIVKKQLKDKII